MTIDLTGRLEPTAAVERAVAAIGRGEPVVLVDDASGRADLVHGAAHATATTTAFVVRHSSGFLEVALSEEACDALSLPPEVAGASGVGPRRVSVDLLGPGTGISATDRAATTAALADPDHDRARFTRPGHVVPVSTDPGGLLATAGRPEAAATLATLAGLTPAAAFAALVSPGNAAELADGRESATFAADHGLALVTISALADLLRRQRSTVERAALVDLPTDHGPFATIGYRGLRDGANHLAVQGRRPHAGAVPLHVHRECLTGDVLRSVACRCGEELDQALDDVAGHGRGVVLYLRAPGAPRACGLFEGAVVEGHLAAVAADIVNDLGIGAVELIDVTADLGRALHERGIAVVAPSARHALVG